MSPYLFRNFDTRARCLLAWPITSMTGSNWRSDMGNLVAIQHFALIFRPLFLISSTGFDCRLAGDTVTLFTSSAAAGSPCKHQGETFPVSFSAVKRTPQDIGLFTSDRSSSEFVTKVKK